MFRLPRDKRLRRRADFVRVQRTGAKVGTRHLLMLVLPRLVEGPGRLGIVASRKVGNAVQRNRAKRLVREAFRLHPAALGGSYDLVVIVRPSIAEAHLRDLEAEVVGVVSLISKRARSASSR